MTVKETKTKEVKKKRSNIIDRTGETRVMNCGLQATIIKYNNCRDIIIRFIETKEEIKTSYINFKVGGIKSKTKYFFGVGRVDDNVETEKSYYVWFDMIRRCYGDEQEEKFPTYIGCTVCEEWLYYSNFKKWYDNNYYLINNEQMQLDKDILHKGNKIYSPENCIFVPQRINSLFVKRQAGRGLFPIGVYYHKERSNYMAKCNIGKGKQKYLGSFNDSKEAFQTYKKFKENLIKEVAEEYKSLIPINLYEAMYDWEVGIDD